MSSKMERLQKRFLYRFIAVTVVISGVYSIFGIEYLIETQPVSYSVDNGYYNVTVTVRELYEDGNKLKQIERQFLNTTFTENSITIIVGHDSGEVFLVISFNAATFDVRLFEENLKTKVTDIPYGQEEEVTYQTNYQYATGFEGSVLVETPDHHVSYSSTPLSNDW